MKLFLITFFLLSVLVISWGCGSSTVETSPAANSNINASNTASPPPVNPVNEVPHSGGPANDINSNSLASLANRRPVSVVNTEGPSLAIPTRPAAENSQVATTMNKEGLVTETRTFQGHPQLSKVEVLWKTPTDKKVTIYLKNGKKVETTGERIENIGTVTTQTLLEMAGVKAAQSQRPPDKSKAEQRKAIQ